MLLTENALADFIVQSDLHGGPSHPDCERYWQGVTFDIPTDLDLALDPFGEEYVSQQLALYGRISGKTLDQSINEHTVFDLDRHVAAINPYDHGSPGGLAEHVERLSRAIRFGAPPRGGRLLDMGCGWGLSSEVAAYSGLEVTAVDVNPDFVALVNRRAERMGHRITALRDTFDTFESADRFAMILFYECFHHAVRPWLVLERMARHLGSDGTIVLAGEPINEIWWPHWGLRLDPLSVYCIRKFGWFESGWSIGFLVACFERAGMNARVMDLGSATVSPTVIGSLRHLGRAAASEIGRLWRHDGWIVEPTYLTGTGDSSLTVLPPPDCRCVVLGLCNFRQRPLHVAIGNANGLIIERDLMPGRSEIELAAGDIDGDLTIVADPWVPDLEIANGDTRRISVHLEDVTFR